MEITEILQKLNSRIGVELGSENETEEQRLERLKKHCEWQCEIENNAAGNLNEYDGYNCDICKNKGYYTKPQLYMNSYSQVQVMCRCDTIRKTIRALNRSGLADVVHDYTFDKYIVTEEWQQTVINTAQAYLNDFENHWFYFGGTTGSGKTHICTAIAVALLKQGKEVKYMLWRDEASRLKALVNDVEYESIIKAYKSVDVLYIDDLFKTGKTEFQSKQRPTQADINLAFEILNSRAIRIKQRCGDYCLNIAPDRSKNYRLK